MGIATLNAPHGLACRPWRVEVHDTQDAFDRLRDVWDPLADRAAIDHPYLTWDWLRTWWECFGGDGRPNLVVVSDENGPVAAAPLMARRRRMWGVPLRSLELMVNSHTPRSDFILTRDARSSLKAIWTHLRERDDWDVLLLAQLPDDSPTFAGLRELAEDDGFLTGVWQSSQSPFMKIAPNWDDYLKERGRKLRYEMRHKGRRLEKQGPVAFENLSEAPAVMAALEEGLWLEGAAWKASAKSAILSSASCTAFYTRLALAAAQRGWMRLQFLTVDRRRVAVHYSMRYGSCLHQIKSGYDPAYRVYSPGTLLVNAALRDAFVTGVTEYDFLGDDAPWKQAWTHTTRGHSWLFVFPDRMRARWVHHAKFELGPRLLRSNAARKMRDVWSRSRDGETR